MTDIDIYNRTQDGTLSFDSFVEAIQDREFTKIESPDDIVYNQEKMAFMDHLLVFVAENSDVTPEQIKSRCRELKVKDARHVFQIMCRTFTRFSLSEIGSVTNRDHATVLHSLHLYGNDDIITNAVNNLIRKSRYVCNNMGVQVEKIRKMKME